MERAAAVRAATVRATAVRTIVAAALLIAPASCTPPPDTGGGGPAAPGVRGLPAEERLLVPPGHGSLRQEEITMTLRSGDIQVKVTPLEEWMIRLTAPDTWRRLSALAATHRTALGQASPGGDEATLFLVSFFSDEDGAVFQPEDLYLENLGRRYPPRSIRPVTGGWGTQRLHGRQAESAVYAFDGALDFDVDLVAEYRGVRNADWARILRDLLAEQGRARARAGVGGPDSPQASSSYFRSLR